MLRGAAVWLVIIAIETAHGVLRELLLVPRIGAELTGRIGWPLGMIIVLLTAIAFARWVGLRGLSELLGLGAMWTVFTLIFEAAIGFARGYDGARIIAEINPWNGGMMLYSLAVMFIAPLLAAKLRGV